MAPAGPLQDRPAGRSPQPAFLAQIAGFPMSAADLDHPGAGMTDPFRLDRARLRRAFDRAAQGYDAAAVLQGRVREELLGRLDVVRLEPAVVLDLGAGTGHASLALKRRYRAAQVVALDLSPTMLAEAARRQTLLRRFRRVCADAAALPLRAASVDLVCSNLMLHWCNDPDAVLRECLRVLRPGGLLTFTTFGPDTLVELRRAWAAADGYTHVNRFIDMHDLGDALVRAGLAEPVMDVERYTLTYATARDLMRDLEAIGARNANDGRPRGLTGKGTLARTIAAYEGCRRDGRLPATYEVVFGQAWAPAARPRPHAAPGEVRVPIGQIGRSGSPRDRNN
jgi:malonyl-CoA O-methyltransferase